MKRTLAICLLLAAWVALCGMGLFPQDPGKVPKTKENYSVTVYDATGVSTKVSRFSIDGETYLPAKRGQASLTIPFDNIAEVSFRNGQASVRLKDGKTAEVAVDKRLVAHGLSEYGPYQISVKELGRVVIHGKL